MVDTFVDLIRHLEEKQVNVSWHNREFSNTSKRPMETTQFHYVDTNHFLNNKLYTKSGLHINYHGKLKLYSEISHIISNGIVNSADCVVRFKPVGNLIEIIPSDIGTGKNIPLDKINDTRSSELTQEVSPTFQLREVTITPEQTQSKAHHSGTFHEQSLKIGTVSLKGGKDVSVVSSCNSLNLNASTKLN
ncbi:hypothetical protein QE152_g40674 [Popillia japonica]|uniref:Uncharacterized protein n=1 Tax=Popillia japonica TaxID=7064 RepID=A0AAW1HG26_POPJA